MGSTLLTKMLLRIVWKKLAAFTGRLTCWLTMLQSFFLATSCTIAWNIGEGLTRSIWRQSTGVLNLWLRSWHGSIGYGSSAFHQFKHLLRTGSWEPIALQRVGSLVSLILWLWNWHPMKFWSTLSPRDL